MKHAFIGAAGITTGRKTHLLHLTVVARVPVDFGLGHQDGDVSLQRLVILVDGALDCLVVLVLARLLHLPVSWGWHQRVRCESAGGTDMQYADYYDMIV